MEDDSCSFTIPISAPKPVTMPLFSLSISQHMHCSPELSSKANGKRQRDVSMVPPPPLPLPIPPLMKLYATPQGTDMKGQIKMCQASSSYLSFPWIHLKQQSIQLTGKVFFNGFTSNKSHSTTGQNH